MIEIMMSKGVSNYGREAMDKEEEQRQRSGSINCTQAHLVEEFQNTLT